MTGIEAKTTLLLSTVISILRQHAGIADISVIPLHFTVKFDKNGFPANNLTVVCKPPANLKIQTITLLELTKSRTPGELPVVVATLVPEVNGGFPMRGPELTHRRYDLNGSANRQRPEASFIRLEFFDASCEDEGEYECQMRFYREEGSQSEAHEDFATVTTQTLPEQVSLVQSPAYDSFMVNRTVVLRCSAQVGSPPAYYRWQHRRVGTGSDKEESFKPLTFGVTNAEDVYPQGFCRYFRSSKLWVRATLDLNDVEVRCILVRGVTLYDNLSASFVFRVKEVGCLIDCLNGGFCDETVCRCPAGYSGTFCQEVVALPCENCQTAQTGSSNGGSSVGKLVAAIWAPMFLSVQRMMF